MGLWIGGLHVAVASDEIDFADWAATGVEGDNGPFNALDANDPFHISLALKYFRAKILCDAL